MELADLGAVFEGTGFNAFASVLASEGGAIKGLAAPGGGQLSRKELDQLVQDAKGRGAAGLVWIVVEGDGVRSPVEKHLSMEEVEGVLRATGASEGDLVCIVADQIDRVHVALDGARRHLADRLGLIPEGEWRYVWYTDPPLFDWSEEEGKWVSNHHPFTAPATDDLDPKTAKVEGVRPRPERLRGRWRQHPDPSARGATSRCSRCSGSPRRRSRRSSAI